MQNTYQNKITDIQSKKPPIFNKLEGGKKFKIESNFKPAGDQPMAIKTISHKCKKRRKRPSASGSNRILEKHLRWLRL